MLLHSPQIPLLFAPVSGALRGLVVAQPSAHLSPTTAKVRGHNNHRVTEIYPTPQPIGQVSLVKELEQQIIDLGVCLLNLIKKNHRVGLTTHRLRKATTLAIPHIPRGRANHTAHIVSLGILAHIESEQCIGAVEECLSQLLSQQCLTYTCRAYKEKDTHRSSPLRQPRTRAHNRASQPLHGSLLSHNTATKPFGKTRESLTLAQREALGRNPRCQSDNSAHLLLVHHTPLIGTQRSTRPDLIKEVNRLVGEVAVGDISLGKAHARGQRLVSIAHRVVLLVAGAEVVEDCERLFGGCLLHHHALKAAVEGSIALKMFAVLGKGGRTNALHSTTRKGRFQDICRIERPLRRACANNVVYLVNKEYYILIFTQILHQLANPLLELSSVLCPCHQPCNIERKNFFST